MATARAEAAVPSGILALRKRLDGRLTGLISLVSFIALWQTVVSTVSINPILVPAPGSVVTQFVEVWQLGHLWPAVAESLSALGVGLAVALVAGVVLGLAVGGSRWLDLITSPYLYGMFATPQIALLPLFVLWLGFGSSIKTLLVVIGAIVPLTLSVKEGVQTVDESLIQAARSFGASKLDLFRKVVVPFMLPFIANGIRNGISRGFVGLLIVEMRVGSGGIGTQVMRSMRQLDAAGTARMFAYVAVLVIVALTLILLSRKFEARISRWREKVYV